MRVVLDSSVLSADLRTDGTAFRLLFAGIASGDHSLYVPEIVIHEVKANYRRRLRQIVDKGARVQVDYGRLTGESLRIDEVDIESMADAYEGRLRRTLQGVGAVIPPYPDVSHDSLVQRALLRRRPFSDTGSGYRDSLIWANVVQVAESAAQTVAFLSMNLKDFSDKGSNLHSDMVADLEQRGIEAGRVVYFPSLESFLDVWVKPRLEEVTEETLGWQVQGGIVRGHPIKHEIIRLMSRIHWKAWGPSEVGLPEASRDVAIFSVDDVWNFRVRDIRRVSETEFLVYMDVAASIIFQDLDGDQWDYHWDDEGLWDVSNVDALLELLLDVTDGRVASLDIKTLHLLPDKH